MDRLETLSKDLSKKIKQATSQKKIELIFTACDFAIKKSQINHPLLDKILKEIKANREISQSEKSELEKVAYELDNKYFDLQEASENGLASTEDYLEAFSKARAVFALLFAFNEDLTMAVSEVIYEASSTIDDKNEFFSLIDSVIEN